MFGIFGWLKNADGELGRHSEQHRCRLCNVAGFEVLWNAHDTGQDLQQRLRRAKTPVKRTIWA